MEIAKKSNNREHQRIREILSKFKLENHFEKIIDSGFDTLERVIGLKSKDLENMEIESENTVPFISFLEKNKVRKY